MDGLSQDRDQYWLIYNLENDKEELIKLPKGYGDGIFLDRKRMLVKKYFDDVEGFYLIEVHFT